MSPMFFEKFPCYSVVSADDRYYLVLIVTLMASYNTAIHLKSFNASSEKHAAIFFYFFVPVFLSHQKNERISPNDLYFLYTLGALITVKIFVLGRDTTFDRT